MTEDLEKQLSELLCDVRIPLENIAFALEQHIRQRGRELDPETRALLAGVRSSLNQVARSTREMTQHTQVPRPGQPTSDLPAQALAG